MLLHDEQCIFTMVILTDITGSNLQRKICQQQQGKNLKKKNLLESSSFKFSLHHLNENIQTRPLYLLDNLS